VATAALILVTAVWGVTFVQVKDAVALYPLFAFLAVRFAIASAALIPPAAPRLKSLGREGAAVGIFLGALLAAAFALQTAGLQRTTVTSTGFLTGLYVLLTPLLAVVLFRTRVGRQLWLAVGIAVVGLVLLGGAPSGSGEGNALVLVSTAAMALQIVFLERYAARFDAFALTLVEMLTICVAFTGIAVALGDLSVPRGATVWGALLVTGLFASAFAFLVQVWAQRAVSATRIAIVFSLETVFAGLFGYLLDGDRLGVVGWTGCALILVGIVLAEPAAATTLRKLVGRPVREPGPRLLG
jgi:drug/metabolite transporter (DMT)-like permease